MLKTLLIVATAMASVIALTAVASADHSWGGYHWARTSSPFTLQLETDLAATTTSNWPAILSPVSSDWSASGVLDTTIVNNAPASKNCAAISGKVRVCNRKYGFNGWLGLASIWISNGHITQGTVKVNDSYFNTSTYNNADAKRHVLCQEVGHTFGLDHQHGVTDSCMNDEGNTLSLSSAVSPNQHDFDELALIYAHSDGTSSVAQSTLTSPHASEIFVHDFGDGRMMVTFVTRVR